MTADNIIFTLLSDESPFPFRSSDIFIQKGEKQNDILGCIPLYPGIVCSLPPPIVEKLQKRISFQNSKKRSRALPNMEKTNTGFELLDPDYPSVNPYKKTYFWKKVYRCRKKRNRNFFRKN